MLPYIAVIDIRSGQFAKYSSGRDVTLSESQAAGALEPGTTYGVGWTDGSAKKAAERKTARSGLA